MTNRNAYDEAPFVACRRALARFFDYSEAGFRQGYDGKPELGYFGEGTSGENGMRTLGNYVFTAAFLATNDEQSPPGSLSQTQVIERARSVLDYMTHTHSTGSMSCVDGKQWGAAWQSSWWAAKMALGAWLLEEHLSDQERQAAQRVIAFEADQHLSRIVPSGLSEDTKAEENAWDAEALAVAWAWLPDHDHAPLWANKLKEFAVNTLSVPQDHWSKEPIDGRPLEEQVYTTNLHSDFTLENHGAMHFCYVASPLLSLTWCMYALLRANNRLPEALFHHVSDLWSLAKPMFLGDRFAYLGGKDWARYTYGLYFIVPALFMVHSATGDTDTLTILKDRLSTLLDEHDENADGSFFGRRVTRGVLHGQPAKYETDCHACLALACLLQKCARPEGQTPTSVPFDRVVTSQESATCYARSSRVFASFSWRTLTQPIPLGLFIPAGMDHAAEWAAGNLFGKVRPPFSCEAVGVRAMRKTKGGFEVRGRVSYRHGGKEYFVRQLRYRADADEGLAVVESSVRVSNDFWCLLYEGLSFAIGNDRFNGYERTYHHPNGQNRVRFAVPASHDDRAGPRSLRRLGRATGWTTTKIDLGRSWVNIDDGLGVVQLKPTASFFLLSEKERNTPAGCLHFDVLACPARNIPRRVRSGELLFDTKFLLVAGDRNRTDELSSHPPEWLKD